MSDNVAQLCRDAYAETRRLYADRIPPLSDADRGFRILYGPPVVDAPVLFVGYQPGGHEPDPGADQHQRWPKECEYATATYLLARRLRAVFGAKLLSRCTGLNRIFFRSPRIAEWRKLDSDLRHDLEAFSLAHAEGIVRALRPQRVVAIGLGTLADLCPTSIALQGRSASWCAAAIYGARRSTPSFTSAERG